jgi:hypothetical protein
MLTLDGLQALTDKMTSPESRNQVIKKFKFFLDIKTEFSDELGTVFEHGF